MSDGVFELMEKEDLTTLEIFYNQRENKFLMRGMKEWDDNVCWDRYVADFTYEDILTDDYKTIGTATLLAAFDEPLDSSLRMVLSCLATTKLIQGNSITLWWS